MITVNPVRRALVPATADAAQQMCSPNYDEFQSDQEITELLARRPNSVLKITMPHCNVNSSNAILKDGSDEALAIARREMAAMKASDLTRVIQNVLWILEITDSQRPHLRQIGLGGMAQVKEIRTEATPHGSIIRNEGIREAKAKGRADLIRATEAIIGMVMNAIDDETGAITAALESYADSRTCDYSAEIEKGNEHKIWLIEKPDQQDRFRELMAAEPCAYVADGNHRSAAAAMLGTGEFMSVFFPARTTGLAPYNRLVQAGDVSLPNLEAALRNSFVVEKLQGVDIYEPKQIHEIGLYIAGAWYKLTPLDGVFDPSNAAQSIDADIVQRKIFDEILGITDPADERLTFVGGNHDANYLKRRVDEGSFSFAISLAPVTIEQFINVCRQNLLMPPKSTWFHPKIRSGLVMALLD